MPGRKSVSTMPPTGRNVVIRTARPHDALPLLALLMGMHREAPVDHAPVSERKALASIHSAISGGGVFIAERNGEMAGSIGAMIAEPWWSETKTLGDLWFYVRPKHRTSRAGYLLFKAFSETAATLGIRRKVAVVYGDDTERKDLFFERFGLIRAGGLYEEGRN